MAWGRLALIHSADDVKTLDKLADVFGYYRTLDQRTDDFARHQVDNEIIDDLQTITDNTDTVPKRPPARFLRINKVIDTETDRNDQLKPSYLSDPSMRLQAAEGTYRFAAPEPLMPIARLLPLLFNSLAQARTGHSLDHRQLLKRIVQGKALQRLPKQQRQRWPQRLQIIVDASPRLEPYWADFECIVKQLQTLLGQEAVQALRFDENTLGDAASYCLPWPGAEYEPWRIWQAPPPDVAVLILSDLGLGDSRASVAWRRQLSVLQQHASPVLTLSPASKTSTDKLFCQQFKPNALNDCFPLPRHPLRTGYSYDQISDADIEDIITWLSPLPLVDTGLLRQLRIAMHWGDSSSETRIWNHPAMRDIGLGICIQRHLADHYQQLFQQNFAGSERATLFWQVVNDHHEAAYQGLRQLEKFKQSFFESLDEPTMRDYFHRLCATGMQSASNPAQQQALRMQCKTILASMPSSIWNSELSELAYPIYAVANEDDIRAGKWPPQLAPGFNPDYLQWVVSPSSAQEKQHWQVVQVGDQGQIKFETYGLHSDLEVNIFKAEVAKDFPPRFTILAGNCPVTQTLHSGFSTTLLDHTKAEFTARGLKVELESITKPSWASRIWRDSTGLWCSIPWLGQELDVLWLISGTESNGTWRWLAPFAEDSIGLYVDLNVKNVTQRFRWLEPGTFWMGSPEDEPEREWGDIEIGKGTETLHQVTLSQGFWMADTSVNQAFWMAVMGDNPSKFTDNWDNPVEQVSWQDVQVFIDKLNSLFPGLSAQLPSEAQWEYACRAGTTTPFSFGANITPEQVNYDGSVPYAEGERGLSRGQTAPVKSLPANPWGLYEMHGNVWEWCADAWQPQLTSQPVTDPLYNPTDQDAFRVVRGGSWNDDGRLVRSAFRIRFTPDSRLYYLGFRLALGHVEPSPGQVNGQEGAAGGGTGRRVAEQRQTEPLLAADAQPTANWLGRLKKSFSKSGPKKK